MPFGFMQQLSTIEAILRADICRVFPLLSLSAGSSTKRSAMPASAIDAPWMYVFIPVVGKPKLGMPVLFSITEATASKSKPVIVGIGVPAIAMKAGFSTSAASTISLMSFSSSPIIASISLMPEI